MKSKRQEEILRLINQHEIDTQEELSRRLKEAGFDVTQATISRDIRELRLSKINTHDGRQKYISVSMTDSGINDRLTRVLKEGYISSSEASRIVVIHTVSGMAMAVAAAIDSLALDGLAGCIAGDDTIMCALSGEADVDELMDKINHIIR